MSKLHTTFSGYLTQMHLDECRLALTLLNSERHRMIPIGEIGGKLNEGLSDWARNEMDLLHKSNPGKELLVTPFVPEILAVVDKFGQSGQSGGSAPFTAGVIVSVLKKLLSYTPVAPIENGDDDWADLSDIGDPDMMQHKRCFSLFKDRGDEESPRYLNAITWRTPKNVTWSGSARCGDEMIHSSQCVKEFPFEPKTFVIDVDDVQIGDDPDDREFVVKNPSDLDEVWNYYNKRVRKR